MARRIEIEAFEFGFSSQVHLLARPLVVMKYLLTYAAPAHEDATNYWKAMYKSRARDLKPLMSISQSLARSVRQSNPYFGVVFCHHWSCQSTWLFYFFFITRTGLGLFCIPSYFSTIQRGMAIRTKRPNDLKWQNMRKFPLIKNFEPLWII